MINPITEVVCGQSGCFLAESCYLERTLPDDQTDQCDWQIAAPTDHLRLHKTFGVNIRISTITSGELPIITRWFTIRLRSLQQNTRRT
jgi:hypothetical protein